VDPLLGNDGDLNVSRPMWSRDYFFVWTIGYDTIEEFNVDSKAEYTA